MPDTTGHMRILKVVQSYFPFQERGGPVFKVRALATGLAKRGHQVTVLTADLGFGKEQWLSCWGGALPLGLDSSQR